MGAGSLAGKSLMQVFFPVDVVPVVIPVAIASVLFCTLIGRVAQDPDTTREGARSQIRSEAKTTLDAKTYRGTFKEFFRGRIERGEISIFPNRV